MSPTSYQTAPPRGGLRSVGNRAGRSSRPPPVVGSGEADLVIAKHRNGGLDTVRLTFQSEYPRFLGLRAAA